LREKEGTKEKVAKMKKRQGKGGTVKNQKIEGLLISDLLNQDI